MEDIIRQVRQEMLKRADPAKQLSGQRFFREPVRMYGIGATGIREVARDLRTLLSGFSREQRYGVCEALWQSGMFEETIVACEWSYAVRTLFQAEDLLLFERWIDRYVTNWASCDTLCNHTVGSLLERYPAETAALKRWALSGNRWMRRAAAVSLIIPARKGLFHETVLDIAALLLEDTDDMVQKGYGWMLKAASQADQPLVFGFVMRNRGKMPRTALRYALEKMPPVLRREAMAR